MVWLKRRIWPGLALAAALCGVLGAPARAQDLPPIIWSVPAHSTGIVSVSFADRGQTVVSAAGDEAKTWQAVDGTLRQTFPDHDGNVVSSAISPNGEYLAVGYIVSGYPPGGVMDLWDVASETVVDTHGGCYVAFAPTGEFIASGGGGANRYAYLHRLADGAEIASYYNGPGYITALAYAPEGHLLAVANTNNTVKLWDTVTHTVVLTLSGHTDDVSCLAFSPDGQFLAGGGGGWDLPSDSSIKLWRVADGALVRSLAGHGQWTHTIAFHPGGEMLVSSGRDSQTPYSASMRFWRVADGELIQEYGGLATAIAYAPDGETFCYGTTGGSLVLAGHSTTPVAEERHDIASPRPARLQPNFPNPFNPRTNIRFTLNLSQRTEIAILDIGGRRLRVLANRVFDAGDHAVVWDGQDASGRAVPSGTYLVRLVTATSTATKKVMLLR